MTIHAASKPKLGYDDYAKIPDDGQRHEIVDGKHFVNPASTPYHQTVSRRLHHQLYKQIELSGRGEVYYAPVDVQLSDHDIVQPDIVLVLTRNKSIITSTRIHGIPDLIVEILSPSSAKLDRVHKKELYQRAGVPEFWLVDPAQRTLEQLIAVNGKFELRPSADKVHVATVENVTVRLADVW